MLIVVCASLAEAGDATGQSGVKTAVYLNAQGDVTPWPTSMTLQVRLVTGVSDERWLTFCPQYSQA